MKKSLLFIAGIFCMILLLAGCPEIPGGGNGYDKLPSDVDPDGGTPVMGNPVVEQLAEIPTSIAGYTKVDTGKTLDGEKIYRLYGTYIYQVGDTYYLDGTYSIKLKESSKESIELTFILGSPKIYGVSSITHRFLKAAKALNPEEPWVDNRKLLKDGFVFEFTNGTESHKYLTFDGKKIYLYFETKDEFEALYGYPPSSSVHIPDCFDDRWETLTRVIPN